MTRTALPPARLRRAAWQGGLSAALALALIVGTASPTAADEPGIASETEYRFPFDPRTTTPEGGEFASKIANGKKRKHPHRGHDFSFGGARGAAIPAVAAGIVRATSSEGPLGNCVALEHADGAFSSYCHMEEPTHLELGQWVGIGETVGKIGGTPKVPVHLHLTMGWSVDAMAGIGTFDPIPYIEARLAEPEPEPRPEPKPKPKPEDAAPEPPDPAEGIAVTHSFATAV
jgi:murein DD-endopeptidase MepM/ murein hydrolase activator NlpD